MLSDSYGTASVRIAGRVGQIGKQSFPAEFNAIDDERPETITSPLKIVTGENIVSELARILLIASDSEQAAEFGSFISGIGLSFKGQDANAWIGLRHGIESTGPGNMLTTEITPTVFRLSTNPHVRCELTREAYFTWEAVMKVARTGAEGGNRWKLM